MKRILAIILSICFVASLTACGKDNATSDITSDITSAHSQSTSTTNQTSDLTNSTETTESSKTTHTHSYSDATCTEPATCSCGVTEGSALGHSYGNATCTEAKKCSRCGVTEGSALGHSYGNATCTEAKKCSRCGVTDGSALGHSYGNATCTEAKKCSRCGVTDGSALGHSYKSGVCSRCGKKEETAPGVVEPADSIHDIFQDTGREQIYVTKTTNVYTGPGEEYEVIGVLNKGDIVIRTSRFGLVGWDRIEYKGKRAYVQSSCLSLTDPYFIAAEAHGFTVGDTITLTNDDGVPCTLRYLGEDKWKDQNGTIWTSVERDDGSLYFTSFG